MTRPAPAPALLVVVVALALGVLLVRPAAGQDDSAPEDAPEDVAGDVNEDELRASGEELFRTACASCHGADGEGTADGPNISEVGELGADFMLRTGRMPLATPGPQAPSKPPAYTDDEIEALVAHVGSLGDGPPIPDVDLDGADLTTGGELFRANCQACHNAAGIGGALSYGRHAPALTDIDATQVVEAMRFGPGEMPVFGEDILSTQQADDVARYVEYLHEPEDPGGLSLGHTGPTTEGFVAWLVGIGLAVWAVRWITSDKRRASRPTPVEDVTVDAGGDP